MFKNFQVIVDTVQKSKLNNIVVNSNDLKTIMLSLTINQLNKPIDLTGATVRIAIVKPDKKTVFQDCTITDPKTGSCEVVLDTQAFIISGVYYAEVMIYFDADKVAVTGRFSYSVTNGILNDSTVESTNEWQSITKVFVDAETATTDAEMAAQSANTATASANAVASETKFVEPYNTTTAYKKNNVVSFNGASYMAKRATTGNAPTDDPGDLNWGILSRKGTDGTGTVHVHKDEFIATEGQTVFTLNNTYDQFQNRTDVKVGGVPQNTPENYEETTSNTITLSEGVPAGTVVEVKYFSESVPLQSDIQTTVDNHTVAISDHSTQLAETGKQFDELNIIASKYGASPSEADSAPFINEALAALKANGGGTLLIPEGYFKIKSPIVVSGVGVYLKAASLYKTRIIADSAFVGSELIRLDQDQVTFNKGVGLEGFYIDCNNVNAHGVTVVNAYDQSGLKHVEVRNTNDKFINFNFIQKNSSQLGQTLLLENCIGEKYGNSATQPVYFFEKYQEVNLVGCKAFPNKANSTPLNGSLRVGDGFYFKDCRGFTLTGCSSAFGENAIVVHAETRNVTGITVVGQTNEQITGYAIKTMNPNSRSIETITCLPIRAEGPSGKFLLDKTTLCTLYTLAANVEITSGSSQNTIFTTDTSKVTNSGIGNTVLGFANYNTTGFSVMELLRILKASSPAMYLGVDSQTVDKKARLSYNASESTDTGISLDKKISGAYVKLLELSEQAITINDSTGAAHTSFKPAPANGYTGMLLTYRADSVTQYRQVLVGAIDSAGPGYRTLRVPN